MPTIAGTIKVDGVATGGVEVYLYDADASLLGSAVSAGAGANIPLDTLLANVKFGTNFVSGFSDETTNAKTCTLGSSATDSDGLVLTGASNSYGAVSLGSDGTLGTGDFCFEIFMKSLQSGGSYHDPLHLPSGGSGQNSGMELRFGDGGFSNRLQLAFFGSAVSSSKDKVALYNTMHHVAILRSGTTARIVIDGISEGTITDSSNLTCPYMYFGCTGSSSSISPSSQYWPGSIKGARFTKGDARYTAFPFTPPQEGKLNFTNADIEIPEGSYEILTGYTGDAYLVALNPGTGNHRVRRITIS